MKFFRNLLLENWAVKLTALLLAFFLWLSVRGDRNVERIISVPLEIRIPRNMEITNNRPGMVELTVRGAPTNIGFGFAGPSAYTIDLQSEGEGTHEIPLLPANVRLPRASGLEVVRVSPQRITLVLEETITKEVAVVLPPLHGDPADGFDIYKLTYFPNRVRLTGPRSRVTPLTQVKTNTISVAGLNQSLRTFSELALEDHSLRANPAGPVEIDIQVGVHRDTRTIAGVPIVSENEAFTVSPSRVSVLVLAPITFKEKLKPENFIISVPADSLPPTAGERKVKPEVRLVDSPDPNIVVDKTRPAEVTVRRRESK